jgi:hypothetical protein
LQTSLDRVNKNDDAVVAGDLSAGVGNAQIRNTVDTEGEYAVGKKWPVN